MANRATYFSPSKVQLLMEPYEEVKHIIKKKGNTATVIKQRENAWQSIADHLNVNVVAKCSGSVHDARVFRAYQRLSQGEFSGVLLGDRGYGCQPFLLTPFTDPQGAQQAYNHVHARSRTSRKRLKCP